MRAWLNSNSSNPSAVVLAVGLPLAPLSVVTMFAAKFVGALSGV